MLEGGEAHAGGPQDVRIDRAAGQDIRQQRRRLGQLPGVEQCKRLIANGIQVGGFSHTSHRIQGGYAGHKTRFGSPCRAQPRQRLRSGPLIMPASWTRQLVMDFFSAFRATATCSSLWR